MTLKLSHHARYRVLQRVRRLPHLWNAIRLPKALGRRVWGSDPNHARVWVTATTVLVVSKNVVITAARLPTDRLADVLVWLMMDTHP